MKELKPKQIYWIMGLLAIIIIPLVIANLGDVEEERGLLRDRILRVSYAGEAVDISLDELLDLNVTNIRTIKRSSTDPDREVFFSGVALYEVLERFFPLALEEADRIIARAADGYTITYKAEEVLEENNIYLIYAEEGEWLKSREDGGDGPFMTIVLEDEFAMRWCRYLTRVTIE